MSEQDRLEWLGDGFDPRAIGMDNVWDATEFMVTRCPVAHGHDEMGDFYVVGKHDDVRAVLQDWQTYNNNPDARVGVPKLPLVMPPIDVNPPMQRQLREILKLFFSPQRVLDYEPGARAIVSDFIDAFPAGPLDIAAALFQPLPPMLTFRLLPGLDKDELDNARFWVDEVLLGAHDHDVSTSSRPSPSCSTSSPGAVPARAPAATWWTRSCTGPSKEDDPSPTRNSPAPLERPRNRYFAFGGGVHRCIGSNFARMSPRVIFEDLLTRFANIEITPSARLVG
jgi:cytochrome P450